MGSNHDATSRAGDAGRHHGRYGGRKRPASPLYRRVREILEAARSSAARSVNTAQIVANWMIGREIVEEEQRGLRRAGYGEGLIRDLAARLRSEYGSGYGLSNLKMFRKFFLEYPWMGGGPKGHAVRGFLPPAGSPVLTRNGHALRAKFAGAAKAGASDRILHALRAKSGAASRKSALTTLTRIPEILRAPHGESWRPGVLHPNLSWTHYRTLLRVEKPEARSYYEIESLKNNWSARELERQINSLLYERLAVSRDKRGLMRLAVKGHEVRKPVDVFKDPVVMEFLGLPESPKLVETELEQALLDNLQAFLLEMGRGFAFVARQARITLDGDHFYIDLVFYHTVLKCYVIVDLKTGKLTHQDLGQMQLYVNYYDRERRTAGDRPTLGLILCADKNDAVVRYTLGEKQKIFARRYKLHLPSEAELRAALRREVKALSGPHPKVAK